MATDNRRAVARHEAGHAVVGTRLNLPIISVDTTIRTEFMRHRGQNVLFGSRGQLALPDDYLEKWTERLPHPEADERLTGYAVMAAAGIMVTICFGGTIGHHSHQPDIEAVVGIAERFGIGHEIEEPAVAQFVDQCIHHAAQTLRDEDGRIRAWGVVATALYERETLTGEEVEFLVNNVPPDLTEEAAWAGG